MLVTVVSETCHFFLKRNAVRRKTSLVIFTRCNEHLSVSDNHLNISSSNLYRADVMKKYLQ